jgi:DNA-binding SARP family transcriptional activator/tetratricopeptide (TPR) repeat protein
VVAVAAGVAFGLLGPLTVRVDGVAVPIPSGKPRLILAALLLDAGRTVTANQLADLLWGQAPPRTAAVTMQNYVKQLRHALGSGRDRIVTQRGGYLIQVRPGELDIDVMEQAISAAHRAARSGAWARTAAQADAALACWRGDPLCDIDSDTLAQNEVLRLAELRFRARELRIEAGLQLGEHADLVAQAWQLAAEVPLREHPQALLIRALHASGRRAEALQAYQDARDVLVGELGCEPGRELQAVHQEILQDAQNPPTAARNAEAPVLGREVHVPRQLPTAVAGFTGRSAEVAALTSSLEPEPGLPAWAPVISAISGTAGVGKTALAVQWAHQVSERFPDGQLYVNLRGYESRDPLAPADALAGFLRALGVPGQQVPDDIEERAGLYRSRLACRRLLVVLDNARDAEQVRLLLPGNTGCAAVITSRDTLAGLVAAYGARRLHLDVLPPDDAVALLRSLMGSRVNDEPGAWAQLAALCARLPLALRVVAEVAASRPKWPLPAVVAELEADRLDGLDAGDDDRTDVRAVFSWSVRHLPGEVGHAFALLGLHPGEDLDAYAAAALTGTTTAQARRILGRLHRASLLQITADGRYGMHDLLRAYARERAAASDSGGQSHAALTRLFDCYLATAAAAVAILYPAESHHRPLIAASGAAIPAMRGEADARAWLDQERANLVAFVVHSAGHGWPRHATGLSGTLFRYLMTGSHLPEAETIYRPALQAARRSGDLAAESEALKGLGSVAGRNGRFRDAASHLHAALECCRRCGDRPGEARILHNLGIIEYELHSYRSAANYYGEAIAVYEDAGDRLGAAGALAELGVVETDLGSYDRAAEHLQLAVQVFRNAKDKVRHAHALSKVGELNLRRGQLTQAAAFFDQALAIYRLIDNPTGVADALHGLGCVSLRQGNYRQAIDHLRQALALHRQAGSQHGQITTLRTLAEALHGDDQRAAALLELEAALRLAAETRNTYQEASSHRDLAEIHHAAGLDDLAHDHWQHALDLYIQVGATGEEAQARSRLRDLGACIL